MPEAVTSLEVARFDASGWQPSLRTVRGVEIFRVGEWNGDKYTTDDIDEMISAFGNQGYGVPLKLGHDEVSGGQAYGWVERIYRIGDTMKADFRDIPEYIFDWVFVQHAYDQVSIEIYFNLKRDGKTFKRALKAIALLGAETPAVSGLAPLRDAIFAAASGDFDRLLTYSARVSPMPDPVVKQTVDHTAEIAALTAKLTESETNASTLTAALKETNEKLASLSAAFAALDARKSADEVNAKVEACKVPALREHIRHIYTAARASSDVVKFSVGEGKTEEKSLSTIVDELVAHVNKLTDTVTGPARAFNNTSRKPDGSSDDASKELAQKTAAYMTEHKLGPAKYAEAMSAVLKADNDLRDRYNALMNGAH